MYRSQEEFPRSLILWRCLCREWFPSLFLYVSSISRSCWGASDRLQRHPFTAAFAQFATPIRMAGGSKIKDQDGYVPPWRQPAPKKEKYDNLKMKAVREPGKGSTMHAPPARKKGGLPTLDDSKPSMFEFDEDLTLAFSRNFQFVRRALSLDTLLMPLPPHVAGSIARNVGFFTRIFTQFFDPKGIEGARESMGLGLERGRRKVKD